MARIMVLEPHPEVGDLLDRIVRRLGHEPVRHSDRAASDVDLVIVEPAADGCVRDARAVKQASGATVVCVSIYPPSEAALALAPVAHVLKPFSLRQLESALLAALEHGESPAA